MQLTTRRRDIVSGICALVLLTGVTTIGVQWSFGAFDDGYRIEAAFAAAGQGLVEGSDVKVRGLDIGHVESIELRDGHALVTMFIDAGRDIPARSSTFTIRPKTLFGEKFVDVVLGPEEESGPFFGDGDRVPRSFAEGDPMPEAVYRNSEGVALRSTGGFELEQVLEDAYPILEAIDPEDLGTVLDELAIAGRGMGETINRSIVNGAAVLDVQATRDAEVRRFIDDLADLAGELAVRAPDIVAGADDLNAALPVLTDDPAALTNLLVQLQGTSAQLADLLEANTAFIDSVYTDGQAVLDTLYDGRNQVVPLIIGLRQYVQVVGGAAHIPVGDGTLMAAVKGIIAGELCGIVPCDTGLADRGDPTLPVPLPAEVPVVDGTLGPVVDPLLGPLLPSVDGEVSTGTQAVVDILTGILGGGQGTQG